MMKINKYGKVVIGEHDIVVTGFEIDGQGESIDIKDFEKAALLWAKKRLNNIIDSKNIFVRIRSIFCNEPGKVKITDMQIDG